MKKILILFAAVVLTLNLNAQTESDVRTASEWTWFGIDYTQCYFLTKMDFPSVSDLESKIAAWNQLPMLEREKFFVKTLPGKDINFSTEWIEEINSKIDVKSRLSNDNFLATHIESSQIQEIVEAYEIPADLSGIGLVLIAESYSKPNVKGAYYATFFDIGTKKVISTKRVLGKAKGFGLKNYWANSYYLALKEIGSSYK